MTGIWPGKTRCVVMLSFDFDGMSLMRRTVPDAEKYPSRLSQGDFGPKIGIFRILDLLDRGIDIIQRITGQWPLGYRSPSWDLSEHSLDLLAERGFVYDSSLMAHDAPYFVDTPKGHRLVELPVSWALDDYPYYAFNRGAGSMNTPQDVYKAWQWEFDGAYQYNSAFILTMHPQVTGRLAKLMALDRLIQYIRSHADVAFMRHVDVARAWTENGMRPA